MSLQVAYGHPPGPTPPADYAPSLRSPWRAAIEVRLQEFGLALHPDKTRLIRFGRFAQEQKRKGPRQTRDLQLPGLYAHYLRGKPSRTFPDSPQNAQRSPTGKTQGDKPRAEKAPSPPGSYHGPLASQRRSRSPELLWCPSERHGPKPVLLRGTVTVVPGALSA